MTSSEKSPCLPKDAYNYAQMGVGKKEIYNVFVCVQQIILWLFPLLAQRHCLSFVCSPSVLLSNAAKVFGAVIWNVR